MTPTSATAALQPITEDDIAQFLLNTPDFFERHAELLASVQLTSPHAGRAVSLLERQVELLRERLRQLELRAAEMIRHGQDNMGLLDRLQRWTCRLLAVDDPADLPAAVTDGLHEGFDVPQVALRLWGVAPAWQAAPWAQGVSDDVRAFATSLQEPYCGANPGVEAAQWVAQPDSVASLALLPLRRLGASAAFGLLVLASPDARRFQAQAGTDFLQRLGEQAAAALSRLLPPGQG